VHLSKPSGLDRCTIAAPTRETERFGTSGSFRVITQDKWPLSRRIAIGGLWPTAAYSNRQCPTSTVI
jgi:hypothetical protein